jgi:hypothetical protein
MSAVLLTLTALGEMAVGVLVAAFPSLGALLVGAPLDGGGLFAARIVGVAAFTLGLVWWRARGAPATVARHAPDFIIYNVGVGIVFGLAAKAAAEPVIPGVLALVHVGTGVLFAVALAIARSRPASPAE